MNEIRNRTMGCLYGQAIGNALGLCCEGQAKQEIATYLQFYDNHSGFWEDDDTNQMLCLLDELIAHRRIDPKSLAMRLLDWLETDGRGCGNLVHQVLRHRNFLNNPIAAAKDRWILNHRDAAPNGALMRTSVIGLYPTDVQLNAENACRVTHYDPRCIGACVIVSIIINRLVWHNETLSCDDIIRIADRYDARIAEWVAFAHTETLADLQLDDPQTMGYTLRTLAAALWCYWHAASFAEGLTAIVNEGGDADTNAAVSCAVLGAKFGYASIPDYYIENLHNKDRYDSKVSEFITFIESQLSNHIKVE